MSEKLHRLPKAMRIGSDRAGNQTQTPLLPKPVLLLPYVKLQIHANTLLGRIPY